MTVEEDKISSKLPGQKIPKLKSPQWSNKSNKFNFYQKIPTELLQGYASAGGLDDGIDLDIIWEKICDSSAVLEVGAGYGRVIKELVKRNYAGSISAIEQCENFFATLQAKYSRNATLYNKNILNFESPQKFPVILMLWSCISDFAKEEQLPVMRKLHQLLQPGGLLIMDTFPSTGLPLNASEASNQGYTVNWQECEAHGYIPNRDEMKGYQVLVNFKSIATKEYVTSTNRNRILYFLEK